MPVPRYAVPTLMLTLLAACGPGDVNAPQSAPGPLPVTPRWVDFPTYRSVRANLDHSTSIEPTGVSNRLTISLSNSAISFFATTWVTIHSDFPYLFRAHLTKHMLSNLTFRPAQCLHFIFAQGARRAIVNSTAPAHCHDKSASFSVEAENPRLRCNRGVFGLLQC